MIPLARAGAHHQPILTPVLVPQEKPRHGAGLSRPRRSFGRVIAEELPQEALHCLQHAVRIQITGKTQRVRHSFFAGGQQRRAPPADLRPAYLLLGVYRHALKFHLLARQRLLLQEKTLRPRQPKIAQDRAFADLLFIHAVFQAEPQQIVELGSAPVAPVAGKEIADPGHIQPFFRKARRHIEIVIRRSVREKGHERRFEIISPRGVPDDVARAALPRGVLLFDHFPKTSARVRSPGMRASITSRIRPRS